MNFYMDSDYSTDHKHLHAVNIHSENMGTQVPNKQTNKHCEDVKEQKFFKKKIVGNI